MKKRNPLSPMALTTADVRPGVQFLWYMPPPSSRKNDGSPYDVKEYTELLRAHDGHMRWGTFTSDPYYAHSNGDLLVECELGDPEAVAMTCSLFDMGISNSRYDSDTWAKYITIAR